METVTCPLCGGAGRPAVREGDWQGSYCDCGVIFLTPRPGEGETASPHAVLAGASKLRTLHARKTLAIVKRHHAAGRVLDLGAGGGHFLVEARRQGHDVAAVEVEPVLVDRLEALGIPCSPRVDRETDVLHSCDVLSHLRDPAAVLREVHRHLSADGLLVLETGNFPDVDRRHRGALRFGLPDHLYFFGEDAVVRLLEDAGFRIIEIRRFSLTPYNWLSSRPKPRSRVLDRVRRMTGPYVLHAARYWLGALAPRRGRPQTIIYVAAKRA